MFALRAFNAGSEQATLANIETNLTATTLPLLPTLLHPGRPTLARKGFVTPVANNARRLLHISSPRISVILDDTIRMYGYDPIKAGIEKRKREKERTKETMNE